MMHAYIRNILVPFLLLVMVMVISPVAVFAQSETSLNDESGTYFETWKPTSFLEINTLEEQCGVRVAAELSIASFQSKVVPENVTPQYLMSHSVEWNGKDICESVLRSQVKVCMPDEFYGAVISRSWLRPHTSKYMSYPTSRIWEGCSNVGNVIETPLSQVGRTSLGFRASYFVPYHVKSKYRYAGLLHQTVRGQIEVSRVGSQNTATC